LRTEESGMLEVSLIPVILVCVPDLISQVLVVVKIRKVSLITVPPNVILDSGRPTDLTIGQLNIRFAGRRDVLFNLSFYDTIVLLGLIRESRFSTTVAVSVAITVERVCVSTSAFITACVPDET
jgi:hypothetical protein